jgi:2-polyprenyl-3-methyl-5-hydroxy-6-metoxy-1,4-benzoquinol methylase
MSVLDLTTIIKSLISQNDWGDKSHVVNEIKDLVNKIEVQGFNGSLVSPLVATHTSMQQSQTNDFEYLKNLLNTEKWPEAVYSFQIADENSEVDKSERAEGIVDVLLPDMTDVKFLDFGCGEGHIAKYCSGVSSISVGYDLIKNTNSSFVWEELDNKLLLTVDFEKVKKNGPYDVVLLYDVLDHAKSDKEQFSSMVDLLSTAKSVLSPEGTIYLRCHPWCSRHGGHLYRKLNKAFIHLIFSQEELNSLGLEVEFTHKVLLPLLTYDRAIKSAGLTKTSESIDRQDLDTFFSADPIIKNRLISIFGIKNWGENNIPSFQMSQCFIDYTLKQ